MQWVETTGKSIEEAKGLALDELGVGEDETDFEILTEPKTGLFGRVKVEARVRARVRPTAVRPKVERRDRKKGREQGEHAPAEQRNEGETRHDTVSNARGTKGRRSGNTAARAAETVAAEMVIVDDRSRSDRAARSPRNKPQPRDGGTTSSDQRPQHEQREEAAVSAQQVGEEAKKFLTDLVAAFGLEGSVELREDGDDLELAVSGADLGLMVGPRGNTLLAVQDLTRVASQRRLGDHDTRLRVDVGGYRERRREALSRFANQIAEQVATSGEARALEPMPSADRKVIHDVLTDHEAVVTRSEGDDPNRRVVIAPANG